MSLTERDIEQMAAEELARQKADLLTQQLNDDFKLILGTVSGRRFVWHLLAECSAFQPIFHEQSSIMYLREGKRQIGLNLLFRIQTVCPNRYTEMLAENSTYDPEEKDQ